ncbi:hypothetical protein F5Y14DRAFT_154127 [Nemania sp. NC0429]|nr:hypothetical protein F5Y14DRAFT_154127 [Nemania sp. NC0429]
MSSLMNLGIRDLSDEQTNQITKLLARRPEYGIAIPSRRWLQRQEEKISQLPKELSRPSALKRIVIKIADRLDPNMVDPQAILCTTHSNLNPFLVRKMFIALAYEVTVHTDPLRSWPGRIAYPELSAFVGRLDSITALWTEPQLFNEIYGLAPFDGHHIFVRSQCEACCLAAVGASGQALADLRAALVDRMERRPPPKSKSGRSSKKHSEEKPRLLRIVESWIDHLRKHHETKNRAKDCRAMSENLLVELRRARPQITAWRDELRRQHADLRAAQRPVYAELKRSDTGSKIKPLPASAGYKRSTRNGIPIALADTEGAESQRMAAENVRKKTSIYRPDSLAAFSSVGGQHPTSQHARSAAGNRPTGDRSSHLAASKASDGVPGQTFLNRFESIYEEGEEDHALNDDDYMERSRSKVEAWWTNQIQHSPPFDLKSEDDVKSVLSMVHPAFRPDGSRIASSALPVPLDVNNNNRPQPATAETAGSAWTDCSVYTTGSYPASIQPGADVPPVPRIPSTYNSKAAHSSSKDKGKDKDKDDKRATSDLNWPAPPSGRAESRLPSMPPSIPPRSTSRPRPMSSSIAEKRTTRASVAEKKATRVSMAASSVYDGTYSIAPSIRSHMSTIPESASKTSSSNLSPDDSISNAYLKLMGRPSFAESTTTSLGGFRDGM